MSGAVNIRARSLRQFFFVAATAATHLLGASTTRAAPGASAEQAEATAVPCGDAANTEPPDPRCGEALDGRAGSDLRTTPSPLLAVPRLASRALFWPVVHTSAFLERHHVVPWARAVLTSDDGLIGVRPRFIYASGFIPTLGLTFFDRRLAWADSELVASATTGGPDIYNAQVVFQLPRSSGLSVHGGWDHRADRLYAGLGPVWKEDLVAAGRDLARYESAAAVAGVRWRRRLGGPFLVDLTGDFQRRVYGSSNVRGGPSVAEFYPAPAGSAGTVDPAFLPGFDEGLRIVQGGASATVDFLEDVRGASGWSLTAGATYAHGVAGDPSRHVTTAANAVTSWGGNDRTLLLRVWAAAVEKVGSAPIPFEELITPAGAHGIRGLPFGRLRGQSALVGSIEYRWLIAYNLDATLFIDEGTVADHRFAGMKLENFFPAIGFGLRSYQPWTSSYWSAAPQGGVQVTYAPDGGVRLLLSTAAF